jgi:hypothetical protein
VLSLSDRLFALIANWPSLGGHEYDRAHWASAAVLGSILIAPPIDELSAALALPPFVAVVQRSYLAGH